MNGETTAVKIHSSSQSAGGRGAVQIWKRGKEKEKGERTGSLREEGRRKRGRVGGQEGGKVGLRKEER